jgi:hypothetical protein
MSPVVCNVDGELSERGAAGVTAEQVTIKIENKGVHVDGETSGSVGTSDKKLAGDVDGDAGAVSQLVCNVDGKLSGKGAASMAAEQVTREIDKNIGHVDGETSGNGATCVVSKDGQTSDSVPSAVDRPQQVA